MEKEPKIEKSETKEKEPEISYHILYGPHLTLKDFEKLEDAFKEADVYIPEEFGSSARTLAVLNELSEGKLTPKETAQKFLIEPKSNFIKEFEVIYNSKKPILFVDVPPGHKLIEKMKEANNLEEESLALFKGGKLKPAVKKMREKVKMEAGLQLEREEVIKKNLDEKLKRFIKNDDQLREKDKIKALLILGQSHSRIYHHLKKEKAPVTWEFAYNPWVFSRLEEGVRRAIFSKNEKLSNTFLARGLIEGFLLGYFARKVTNDISKAAMASRKISSKLDLKDIAKVSKEASREFQPKIVDCLKKQNVEIPETEEELDKMLKNKES